MIVWAAAVKPFIWAAEGQGNVCAWTRTESYTPRNPKLALLPLHSWEMGES